MSKHTPGPWAAELGSDGSFAIEADGRGITSGLLVLASRNAHPLLAEQMYANARLIAAAPDLLRELEHLVRLVEPCVMDGRASIPGLATLNGARAAIAKAKGEA